MVIRTGAFTGPRLGKRASAGQHWRCLAVTDAKSAVLSMVTKKDWIES